MESTRVRIKTDQYRRGEGLLCLKETVCSAAQVSNCHKSGLSSAVDDIFIQVYRQNTDKIWQNLITNGNIPFCFAKNIRLSKLDTDGISLQDPLTLNNIFFF